MKIDLREHPTTSDGKEIVLPNLFRGDVYPLFHGRADDVTNGDRMAGSYFQMQKADSGDTSLEFQFINWVYMAGGLMSFKNAVYGDRVNFKIYAPASPATENTGAGAYDKYNLGGPVNIFIPNATQEGDWDLNLTEKKNANVDFMKVVPVPTAEGTGWFDWNHETEAVTLNEQGKGNYHLFDVQLDLVHYVIWQPLLGDGVIDFIKPAVKPRRMLPHWVYKTELHRADSGTLDLVWSLLVARKDPTP